MGHRKPNRMHRDIGVSDRKRDVLSMTSTSLDHSRPGYDVDIISVRASSSKPGSNYEEEYHGRRFLGDNDNCQRDSASLDLGLLELCVLSHRGRVSAYLLT